MILGEIGIKSDDTRAALLVSCVVSLLHAGVKGVGVRGHFESYDERLHFQ